MKAGPSLSLAALWMLASLPAAAFERAPLPSEAPLQPCPEYGAGFGRIPGTSTCLRISGRVAAEVGSNSAARSPVSGRFAIDTRSPSDYGPVRAFVRGSAGH